MFHVAHASRSLARLARGNQPFLGSSNGSTTPTAARSNSSGADLRTLDRTELRAQFGYVEQDAPVLAGTLRDNLLLASPQATDAACERCCAP